MFVKVRVSALRLREHADKLNYPLRIDEDQVKATIMTGKRDPITDGWIWWPRKNGWKEQGKDINTAIQDEKGQSDIPYFQYIYGDFQPEKDHIYQMYQPSNSMFRGVDRIKIIMSILESAVHNDGCGLNLNRLCVEKAVLAVYPLHDDDELLMLQSKWITAFAWPWNQPIERIKDYFGEKIALYFCWLGHYTTWLIGASVLGSITYVIVVLASLAHESDDVPYEASPTNPVPLFAFLMALWATFFLEYWKREEKRRAMMWGMVGFEDTEEDRPEYEGLDIRSPINGGPDTYFPASEKNKRVAASQSIIVLCAICVLGAVLAIFLLKAVLEAPPVDLIFAIPGSLMGGQPYPIGGIFASVVNAVQIQVMNNMYSRVAHFLNALENHRTETLYEDNLIAKTFVFQFVNSYTSLFYIAFVKDLTAPKYEAIFDKTGVSARSFMCKKSCMTELSGQLGTIFITRLIWGNITEVVLPAVRIKKAQAAARKVEHDDSEYDNPHLVDSMTKRQRSPAEEQFELDYYDQLLGTFSDYAELIMQFGYATLFVSAFPLAPLMAFVNNYVEIRVDGWKLCQNCRRPLPSGAEDIGTWQSILEIMSICAVVCNCALITYTGEFLEQRLHEDVPRLHLHRARARALLRQGALRGDRRRRPRRGRAADRAPGVPALEDHQQREGRGPRARRRRGRRARRAARDPRGGQGPLTRESAHARSRAPPAGGAESRSTLTPRPRSTPSPRALPRAARARPRHPNPARPRRARAERPRRAPPRVSAQRAAARRRPRGRARAS